MRKTILTLIAASVAVTAVPAAADPPRWAPAHGHRANHDNDRDDRRYESRRVYDDRGRYVEPRRVSRGDSVWRGNDNRYYCRRDNGTTGLIIGAAGGALIGREVDNQGSRTVGTILGAAIGGLLGREIDRGGARCQ
jgi:hypothetical protein